MSGCAPDSHTIGEAVEYWNREIIRATAEYWRLKLLGAKMKMNPRNKDILDWEDAEAVIDVFSPYSGQKIVSAGHVVKIFRRCGDLVIHPAVSWADIICNDDVDLTMLFKRADKKKMTVAEIEKALGHGVEVVK